MSILVTGAAGFIGSNIMKRLAEHGEDIVGIDNINDYYDPALKYARLAVCGFQPRVTLEEGIRHFAQWYTSDQNPLEQDARTATTIADKTVRHEL